MKRDVLLGGTIVAVLLVGGLLVGRALPPASVKTGQAEDAMAFRTWFWEQRTFDLLAQIALIFAGAVGVSAVLPRDRESDEPSDDESTHAHAPPA
jgi:hypothetical protein